MDRLNEKLTEATRRMRRLQKNYFRQRDPETLKSAMRAEREVDLLLENIGQPDLFAVEGRYND